MAESARGQYEANPLLWLAATWADKKDSPLPPGIFCVGPARKSVFWLFIKSFIGQACSVKDCWILASFSFLRFYWPWLASRSIKTHKRTWPILTWHAWSIRHIMLYCSLRTSSPGRSPFFSLPAVSAPESLLAGYSVAYMPYWSGVSGEDYTVKPALDGRPL